jgi:hypothetical protein
LYPCQESTTNSPGKGPGRAAAAGPAPGHGFPPGPAGALGGRRPWKTCERAGGRLCAVCRVFLDILCLFLLLVPGRLVCVEMEPASTRPAGGGRIRPTPPGPRGQAAGVHPGRGRPHPVRTALSRGRRRGDYKGHPLEYNLTTNISPVIGTACHGKLDWTHRERCTLSLRGASAERAPVSEPLQVHQSASLSTGGSALRLKSG